MSVNETSPAGSPVILNTSLDYSLNWTTICNYALNRLGVGALLDLSEGNINAQLCNRFLPQAVRHLLSEYDFNFAKRRMRLAPLVDRPLFGWKYQYTLPGDMLRIIKVYGTNAVSVDEADRVRYQIEGKYLLTDEGKIEILYIAPPETADLLPFHFVDALAAYLASLLAPAVTSSEQMIMVTAQQAAVQVENAKRMDARLNYAPEEDGERWYTEAR
jgi:hypothetical protein